MSCFRSVSVALVVAVALVSPLALPAADGPGPSMNSFALEFYRTVAATPGNVFVSPYSISSALTMTGLGAGGATAGQMSKVLHLNVAEPDTHRACAALTAELEASGAKGGHRLAVANRLWGQKGYEFKPEYLKAAVDSYGAALEPVDFQGDTEGARKTINGWVEARTEQRIRELIPTGILDGSSRLVLTNAVYFKGSWERAFKADATVPGSFRTGGAASATVPFMRQTAAFPYGADDLVLALELPYRGGELTMVVLLPAAVDGLPAVEAALGQRGLEWPLGLLREQKVRVELPRFKTTWAGALNEPLQALGMVDAFAPGKADFSGMTGTRDLYISKVLHKAFVDVNEEGTEAAAATAVVMSKNASMDFEPPPLFRADHPFLFLIRHKPSGLVLFLGRVADPSATGE